MITIHDQFEQEEWRVIAEFPDYAVSDLGRVKRVVDARTSRAGRIIKQYELDGYKSVSLSVDGKEYGRRINRLVCAAFHGPAPSPTHHAAHNDGVRGNNSANNLRWATPFENAQDRFIHGTVLTGDRAGARLHPERRPWGKRNGKYTKPEATPRGEAHGNSVFSETDVRKIRADTRPNRQIAKEYGVSKGAVDGIKYGRTWRHVV